MTEKDFNERSYGYHMKDEDQWGTHPKGKLSKSCKSCCNANGVPKGIEGFKRMRYLRRDWKTSFRSETYLKREKNIKERDILKAENAYMKHKLEGENTMPLDSMP